MIESLRESGLLVPLIGVAAILFALSFPAVRECLRRTANWAASRLRRSTAIAARPDISFDAGAEQFHQRMDSYRMLHRHLEGKVEATAKLESQLPDLANDRPVASRESEADQ